MVLEELKLLVENDMKKHRNNDYQIVSSLKNKIEKLKSSIIVNITEEEKKYLNEESSVYLQYIYDCFEKRAEIPKSNIEALVDFIINELNKNYIVDSKYTEKINELNEIDRIIKENLNSDYSKIFEYIRKKYQDKTINNYYASYLILELAKHICNKDNVNEDQIILEENIEVISDNIIDLFNKYGYDFQQLNESVKEQILKYGKLDIINNVLKIMSDNKIEQELLLDKQKSLARIFFDKDNTIEEIAKFAKDNNCKFSDLFKIDGIFHKRRERFLSINRKYNNKEKTTENDEWIVTGVYDDFVANFELLKEYKQDLNINDIFNKRIKRFIITPNKLISKNLQILRKYKLIGENELPDSLTSLTGIHTEYHLDRYIEMGMYDYIKKNTSKLWLPRNLKYYYKIRRGQDLDIEVLNSRGISGDFMKDDLGIEEKEDGSIIQTKLTEEQLASIPEYKKREITVNDYYGQNYYSVLYGKSYKYSIFKPKNILKNVLNSDVLIEKVNAILNGDIYDESEYNEDNEVIKILDKIIISRNDGNKYPIKLDDNTYQFISNKFPNNPILISRNKVIKVMNLLDKNIFATEKLNYDEKIGIILCAITKDSVLSYWELRQIRVILKHIIPSDNLNKVRYK